MLRIWWSVFLIPALMLLYAALARLLPLQKVYPGFRPLSARQQKFADGMLRRMLWQFALALAALAFMVMQTLRLVPISTQFFVSYGIIVLQLLAVAAMAFPIEKALRQEFGEEETMENQRVVTERACAKVNLLLAVGEKRHDGYHDLVSVMQTVGVWDELTIRAHTGGGIALTCDDPNLASDETNLCYKAAVKFFTYTGVDNDGVSIDLKKTLPMQAGLGGGSADAAAVLRGLRELYDPELPDEELEAMAADLGSDVPFCVRGGTALARGRGEKLKPLPRLPECWFVLVKPPVACPTGRMYGLIDEGRFYDSGEEQAAAMTAALDRGDLTGVCAAMLNTFERVLPPDSEIFAIRDRLLSLGATGTMLSGSGSAVFAVFDREETARMAAAALRGNYPETFCGKGE